MNSSSSTDILAEVWAIKDSLSASHGHSLKETCSVMYAEQAKHPADFVNLGAKPRAKKTHEVAGKERKSSPSQKRRVRTARVSA